MTLFLTDLFKTLVFTSFGCKETVLLKPEVNFFLLFIAT